VGNQEDCKSVPPALVEDTIPAEVGKYSIVTNARARVQLEFQRAWGATAMT